MIVLDANILVYARNQTAPEHGPVSKWLAALFSSAENVAIPWITIWAFLPVTSNPRVFAHPLTPSECFLFIREWLQHPGVIDMHPGRRHSEILERLMTQYQAAGPLVTDAVLAALAIENGATLASTDQDFRRFPTLMWVNPLAPRDAA